MKLFKFMIIITRLTENVSKTKHCIKHMENCKTVLECSPKSEKMFKFCSKVKKVLRTAGNVKVLQIRKSAERNRDMPRR